MFHSAKPSERLSLTINVRLEGERRLPRKARKRGGKAKKPGLSSEQTPILIARDRYGHHLDAVLPDRSEASVSAVFVLLTDATNDDRPATAAKYSRIIA